MVVCAGVIYLRYKRPEIPRTFRSPFVPLFPLLGICFCTFLAVYGLDRTTWIWFVGALVAGLAVFFIYGFRNSGPGRHRPGRRAGSTLGFRGLAHAQRK